MSLSDDWSLPILEEEDDEKKESDYADEFEFNIPGPDPNVCPRHCGFNAASGCNGNECLHNSETVFGHHADERDYMPHINIDACS